MIFSFLIISLAYLYCLISLLICPIYYPIKYAINKLFNKNYKYQYLTGGFKLIPCKNREEVEKLFIIYRVPDKNFKATFMRKLMFKTYFIINMSYNDYASIDYKVLSSLSASYDNYKRLIFVIPKNLFKNEC